MPPLRRGPFLCYLTPWTATTPAIWQHGIEELSPQEDSGNAIFIAALLDGELQRLLLTFMPTISNILAERLFDDYGPLNSFAAKIDIARALDLIDMGTYTDLRAIQVIRNTFAHPTDRLNFKSPEIERRGISLRVALRL